MVLQGVITGPEIFHAAQHDIVTLRSGDELFDRNHLYSQAGKSRSSDWLAELVFSFAHPDPAEKRRAVLSYAKAMAGETEVILSLLATDARAQGMCLAASLCRVALEKLTDHYRLGFTSVRLTSIVVGEENKPLERTYYGKRGFRPQAIGSTVKVCPIEEFRRNAAAWYPRLRPGLCLESTYAWGAGLGASS